MPQHYLLHHFLLSTLLLSIFFFSVCVCVSVSILAIYLFFHGNADSEFVAGHIFQIVILIIFFCSLLLKVMTIKVCGFTCGFVKNSIGRVSWSRVFCK